MATIAAPPADRKSSERKFYSRMAILLVVVVFLGFAPSFYLKGIVPPYPRPNPTLPPAVLFHGLMFTLWMALLVLQTQLVATRRTETHMKLGKATMLVAIALIPVMYLTAVWAVPRHSHPPFTDDLNWTAIPLAVIPAFAFLVYEAWRRRKESQWHKRLMLSATIIFAAGPGFSRIPLAPPTFWGFTAQLLGGTFLLFLPMFIWDRRTQGKIHPATWTGYAVATAAAVIPLALIYTKSWAGIAAKLPGVGA
jgi:cytochrome bd-type quinol oxidase subunit 2